MGVPAADTTARLWDVASGRELRRVSPGQVYSVTFSADGRRLLTTIHAGPSEAVLWDVETGRRLVGVSIAIDHFRTDGFLPCLAPATLSPDGRVLLGRMAPRLRRRPGDRQGGSSGLRPHLRLGHGDRQGDPPDRRARGHDQLPGLQPRRATHPHDLPGRHRQDVGCRDRRAGPGLPGSSGSRDDARSSAPAPTAVVTASADGTVRLWDAKTGRELQQFRHGGTVNHALIRRDGRRIIANWETRDRDGNRGELRHLVGRARPPGGPAVRPGLAHGRLPLQPGRSAGPHVDGAPRALGCRDGRQGPLRTCARTGRSGRGSRP